MSSVLFCIAGNMAVICMAKVANTSLYPGH
jgi:hypothetical protein